VAEHWRSGGGALVRAFHAGYICARGAIAFHAGYLREGCHLFPPCENVLDMIHAGPRHTKREITPPDGGEQSSAPRETLATPRSYRISGGYK
jgi:hypothetical protein